MWQRLAARVLFVDLDVVAVDMHVVGRRVRPAVRPGACVAAMFYRIRTIHLKLPSHTVAPTTFADRHDVNIVPAMQPEGCGRSRPKM